MNAKFDESQNMLIVNGCDKELRLLRRALNRALKHKQGKPFEYSEGGIKSVGFLAIVRYEDANA